MSGRITNLHVLATSALFGGVFAVAVSQAEKTDKRHVHVGVNSRGRVMIPDEQHSEHASNTTNPPQLLRTSRPDTTQSQLGEALDQWRRIKRRRWFREQNGRTYMTAKKVRRWRKIKGSLPGALGTVTNKHVGLGCTKWPTVEPPPSLFRVQNISDLGLPLRRTTKLLLAGAAKGILSLGNFLIVASENYPDHLLVYAANVAAEILDSDKDGCPSSIAACFDGKRETVNTAYVVNQKVPLYPLVAYGGCTKDDADEFTERYANDDDGIIDGGPVSDLQTWNVYDDSGSSIFENAVGRDDRTEDLNALHGILNEEIYHSLTQGGYCRKYPKELGVEAWTSVLAKAVLEAEGCQNQNAAWYSHPENNCSNMPHVGDFEKCADDRARKQGCWVNKDEGDGCLEANCDIVEFLHKVMYLHVGVPQECDSAQEGQNQCCEMYDMMNDHGVSNSWSIDLALQQGFYGRLLFSTLTNPTFEMLQSLPTGQYEIRPSQRTTCPEPKANFTCLPMYGEDEEESEKGLAIHAGACTSFLIATSTVLFAVLSPQWI